jgi:hypothetical protein
MTRFMFLFTWLQGPRVFSRFILFFMVGMLFLFYCLIGGLSYVPAAPAHAIKSPYPAMPKPNPIPPNTAEVMRKRMTSGPRMQLNVPAPESSAKPVPYE